MMFGGFNSRPPVVPGRDGAQRPKDPPACAACRAGHGVIRTPRTLDGIETWLCLDWGNCNARARGGVTFECWLADMQAETAAWTPLTYKRESVPA